jgi:hypothetical protein
VNAAQVKDLFLPGSEQLMDDYYAQRLYFPIQAGNAIRKPADSTGAIDECRLRIIDTHRAAKLTYTDSTAGHWDLEGSDVLTLNIRETGEYPTTPQGWETVHVSAQINVVKVDGNGMSQASRTSPGSRNLLHQEVTAAVDRV